MRLFEGTEWDIPPRCERCGELEEACQCEPPPKEWKAPEKQTARLQLEKRKRGKLVTVIRGLKPDETDFATLLPQLQSACGAGGAIREETLEIQGDHRSRIEEILSGLGYRVR